MHLTFANSHTGEINVVALRLKLLSSEACRGKLGPIGITGGNDGSNVSDSVL